MKSLEAIDNILNILKSFNETSKSEWIDIDKMENDFITIETALKALEIIKEKMVNVCAFISWNNIVDFTYKKYLDLEFTYLISAKRLTQEEFNLLKEIILDKSNE